MNEQRRRMLVGIVLPVVGIVVAVVASAVTSVPDPLATHWGFGGEPDDSMSRAGFLAFGFVLIGLGALAALVASRRSVTGRGDLVAPVAIATFLQWVFVGVSVFALAANDGADTWSDARSLPLPIALLVPISAGVVATVAGGIVREIGERTSDGPGAAEVTVAIGESERLVWLRQVNSRWPIVLGGGIAVVGSAFLLAVGTWSGLLLLLVGVVVAWLATIRVIVDQHGLTVRYGPLGWPKTVVALPRIRHAEEIDVRPTSHGGWGYRGSLRLFGRAAVVVRAGEGIRLELEDGKQFVVTVDDAATGAASLNALVNSRPTIVADG